VRHYRAPSQIVVWNECDATDCGEALAKFRAMGMTLDLTNIQIEIGRGTGNWAFAETIPGYLGGYAKPKG
jgi:hypothetical protein